MKQLFTKLDKQALLRSSDIVARNHFSTSMLFLDKKLSKLQRFVVSTNNWQEFYMCEPAWVQILAQPKKPVFITPLPGTEFHAIILLDTPEPLRIDQQN